MRISLFTVRPILNASSSGEMRLSQLVSLPIQLESMLTSRRRSEGDAARPGTIATVTRRGSICCGRGGHQSLGLSRGASTRGSRGSHTCLDQGEPRLSHLVPTRDTFVPVAEFITCDIMFLEYMAYAPGTVEEDTRCLDSAAQRDSYKSREGRRGFTPGTDTRHGSTAANEVASTRGRCGFTPDTDTRGGSAGGGKEMRIWSKIRLPFTREHIRTFATKRKEHIRTIRAERERTAKRVSDLTLPSCPRGAGGDTAHTPGNVTNLVGGAGEDTAHTWHRHKSSGSPTHSSK